METGWAGRVMVFLTYATHIVVLNFLWVLGTLAGGIVLGIAPATHSLGRLFTALTLGSPSPNLWTEFWRGYARGFKESNRKAWPFTVLALLAVADLAAFRISTINGWGGATALLPAFVVVTLLCLIAHAYFHASLLRFSDSWGATLKFAFAAPLTFLPATIAILLVNVAFLMLTWQLPLAALLVGFSIPLGFSIVVAGSAIDRAYSPGFRREDVLLVEANAVWEAKHASD
ncbi:YesL family protein [Timonella senegalensis]|uniref:YesL family protein n=1 Tax=Timonella senegalensis TaxID=1465825 RepID=UPI0002EB713F|nr:DUF624 domain-containing protein [Timonella senegalensis]